jgi:hypothetical protein
MSEAVSPSKMNNKPTTGGSYEPIPVVKQSTILAIGFGLFALAYVWPPLILVVAYIVSLLVPYSFRTNDDSTSRRILFHDFRSKGAWRLPYKDVVVKESYWVNQR